MEILSLIIAVIALGIAVAAFRRTGGVGGLKRQVQGSSPTTDSVRDRCSSGISLAGGEGPRAPV